MPLVTSSARLLRAHEAALAGDQRVDRLFLNPVAKRVPNLPIHDSLLAARVLLTIEGASTLELELHDPDWVIEASGLLDRGDDGRLDAIDVVLDTIVYRLTSVERTPGSASVQMVFEDRAVALLRARSGAMSASRNSMTRAMFLARLVGEVKSTRIFLESPNPDRPQLIEKAERPPVSAPSSTSSSGGDSGFDADARLTVKGEPVDGEQRRNIEIALGVADQENAGPKATLALIVAGIGESSFRRSSLQPQTKAEGVYQLIPATARALALNPRDTEATARHFLVHGYYRYGGAIKLARENPGMTVGEIVSKVEGSDAGGSFYQAYADEARKIVAAWNKGHDTGTSGDSKSETVLRVKSYQFRRGTPDKPHESTWDAALRLAEEVGWRFYVTAGVAVFINDDRLLSNRAALVIDDPRDPALMERPGYQWHQGKLAGDVELHVNTDRYAIAPGAPVALTGRRWGPVNGRWIVLTAEYDLFDSSATTLTLTKPMAPRKEPAADVYESTHDTDPSDDPSAGTVSTKGGAKGIVEDIARIAIDTGGKDCFVVSANRPGATTTSGNVSDHSQNNSGRAARDIAVRGIDAITGPPSPKLNKAVVKVGETFGRDYGDGAKRIVDTFQWRGYQIQIIWHTPEYGGHMGHIHAGAHKV